MGRNVVVKMKDFFIHPLSAYEHEKAEPWQNAVKYLLLLSMLYSTVSVIMARIIYLESTLLTWATLALLPVTFFVAFLNMLCIGLTLSIITYPIKGKKAFKQTLKAVFYGLTPFIFLTVPYLGTIAWLWTAGLISIGLIKMHKATFSIWLFLGLFGLTWVVMLISHQLVYVSLAQNYFIIGQV